MKVTEEVIWKMFQLPQETHPERMWVLSHLPEDLGTVYDLGCGRHKTISRAIGVDLNPVADIQASIDSMPMIASDSADTLISRHSLEHMLDIVKTLQEWHRILKVNGRLIIVLPWHGNLDTMSNLISCGTHMHAFTPESFMNLLRLMPHLFRVDTVATVMKDWSFGLVLKKLFYV